MSARPRPARRAENRVRLPARMRKHARLIAVDLGSSFIKGRRSTSMRLRSATSSACRSGSYPGSRSGFREFDPRRSERDAGPSERLLRHAPDAEGIVMCGQLHGMVLADERGNRPSPTRSTAGSARVHLSGRWRQLPRRDRAAARRRGRRRLGNEARPGLPLCHLFWLVQNERLPREVPSSPRCRFRRRQPLRRHSKDGCDARVRPRRSRRRDADWHRGAIEKPGSRRSLARDRPAGQRVGEVPVGSRRLRSSPRLGLPVLQVGPSSTMASCRQHLHRLGGDPVGARWRFGDFRRVRIIEAVSQDDHAHSRGPGGSTPLSACWANSPRAGPSPAAIRGSTSSPSRAGGRNRPQRVTLPSTRRWVTAGSTNVARGQPDVAPVRAAFTAIGGTTLRAAWALRMRAARTGPTGVLGRRAPGPRCWAARLRRWGRPIASRLGRRNAARPAGPRAAFTGASRRSPSHPIFRAHRAEH